MSTAPIISVNSVVSSPVAPKASSPAESSDQSFGQVLSREVNDRNSNTAGGQASAPASNSNSTSNSTNTTSASGAKGKTKSSDNASQTSDPNSNTTANTTTNATGTTDSTQAQMLALVSNVQQGTPTDNSATSATQLTSGTGESLAIGKVLNAAKLVVPVQTAPLPTPASAAENINDVNSTAGAITNNQTSLDQQLAAQVEMTAVKPANVSTNPEVNNIATNKSIIEQNTEMQSNSASQNNATDVIALDINAVAEKNIQTGLASLNANAVKVEQAVQTTPNVTAAVNAQQTSALGQALPTDPNDKLTPQVGSNGWDQALGQKVVWMVAGGQQNASLTLNPPDLGPMQVVLNVTNSHATVTFSSTQPEVRQALESAIPKLREMLGDAGIQLGQASINSGSPQQQQTASQQNIRNSNSLNNAHDAIDTNIPASRAISVHTGQGLVDTFA